MTVVTNCSRRFRRTARSPAGPSNLLPSGQRPRRIDRGCRLRRPSAIGPSRRSSRARTQADPSGRGTMRTRVACGAPRAAPAPTRDGRSRPCPSAPERRAAAAAAACRAGCRAPTCLCSTGDVRFGYDVTVRRLPWPSSPRAVVAIGAERSRAGSARRRRPGFRSAAPAAR